MEADTKLDSRCDKIINSFKQQQEEIMNHQLHLGKLDSQLDNFKRDLIEQQRDMGEYKKIHGEFHLEIDARYESRFK